MRKVVAAAVALLVLLTASGPAQAWGGRGHRRPVVATRVFIGAGPFWWGPPYPYWYYPYPYWAPPPAVVREEPPVYIQQEPAPPAESYWYYCPSAKGYYPTVPQCPEAWIKVAPRAQ